MHTVLVGPAPVPNLVDGSLNIVKGHVPHRELLVTKVAAVHASVEGKIGHETTATRLDEDSLVLCACK